MDILTTTSGTTTVTVALEGGHITITTTDGVLWLSTTPEDAAELLPLYLAPADATLVLSKIAR